MSDPRPDTSSDETLEKWLALPSDDLRTLAEFSEQYGIQQKDTPRGVLWWNGHEHVIRHIEEP